MYTLRLGRNQPTVRNRGDDGGDGDDGDGDGDRLV